MTVRTVLSSSDPPFTWVDVVHPIREELGEIARRYGLHPTLVEDSLEPEHLPKYERIGSTTFIGENVESMHFSRSPSSSGSTA